MEGGLLLGYTTEEPVIRLAGEEASWPSSSPSARAYWRKSIPPAPRTAARWETISCAERATIVARHKVARPKAVIPVFPGTNCEYDTAAACLRAEIEPEILVVRNLTGGMLAESADALEKAIQSAQMVVLPGGFSGGDEPDGSAKFICSFLRNPRITDAIHDLLKNRDGLMLGICNGFQALVKLGLVPYGEIRAMDENGATLTYNNIGRHQSRYVTTRIASVRSPWMLKSQVGGSARHPHLSRRGPLCGPRGPAGSAGGQWAGGHPVCGRAGRALHGYRRESRTVPCGPSRIFFPPTAGCSARWEHSRAPRRLRG